MSGPQASASQLQPPAGAASGQQALLDQVESPELARTLIASRGAVGAGSEAPLASAPAQDAPASQADMVADLDSVQGAQPQAQAQTAQGAPDASAAPGASPADASMMAKILARVSDTPEGQAQILKHWDSNVSATRVTDGKAEFQTKGSTTWQPVKPDWFSSFKNFATNVGGLAPGAAEMGVQVGGAAAGAIGGAAAGGVGAIPGEIAGSAAASVAAMHMRQSMSELLGASPQAISAMDNVYAAGLGAAGSAGALALRKPIEVMSQLLKDSVMAGKTSLGVEVSGLHQQLAAMYGDLTGRSAPALKDVGNKAASALEAIEGRYGENVGAARRIAADVSGSTPIVPNSYKQEIQSILQKDYNTSQMPKLMDSDPTRWQITPKAGGSRLPLPGLVSDMNEILNDGGYTMAEMTAKLGDVKAKANFNSSAPTEVENLYRKLYYNLSQDENAAMSQAVHGTPSMDFVNSAKGTYSESIDALRKVQMDVNKAPEKYAVALTKDSLTAQRAKDLLTNPLNQLETGGPTDGMSAWDALKSSWLGQHFDAVRGDKGTGAGLVDIPKLFARLDKQDGAVADVMLGEGWREPLGRLANAMAKTNWQDLAANPDSIPHTGLLRSTTKFFMSGMSPIYGAHVMSDLAGIYHGASSNQILRLIQEKGINQFAKEAETIQGQALQMKASRAIDTILKATNTTVGLGGGTKVSIPIEASMVPVLLGGRMQAPGTPPAQAMQAQNDAFQTYRDHQSQRFADLQEQLNAAKARGDAMSVQGLPKFVSMHRMRSLH